MNRDTTSERGASLITAIVILVFVALFGTTVVSMVSTQNLTSVGETQSTQALYVAEGGSEFAQRALAQNLNWYRSAADPIVTPATALGNGTFTGNIYLPATELSRRVVPASPTIPVFTTARFPAPSGTIQLDDDIGGGAEFVRYTGTTATTFTGLTRNVAINGISGGAVGTFARGTRVYPVTTLVTPLGPLGACGPTTAGNITIATHTKFPPAGTIMLDPEQISYTGSTPGPLANQTTLTGVVRCVNSLAGAHAAGDPVTTLLYDLGGTADYEAFAVVTGTVGSAPLGASVRVVQKSVQR
jgi:hypothetical protein